MNVAEREAFGGLFGGGADGDDPAVHGDIDVDRIVELSIAGETRQVQAMLEDLCTMLVYTGEMALMMLDATELVVKLVAVVQKAQRSIADITILAVRAIALIIETCPRGSTAAAAADAAVPALLDIVRATPNAFQRDVELGEAVLRALQHASATCYDSFMEHGGLGALAPLLQSSTEWILIPALTSISSLAARCRPAHFADHAALVGPLHLLLRQQLTVLMSLDGSPRLAAVRSKVGELVLRVSRCLIHLVERAPCDAETLERRIFGGASCARVIVEDAARMLQASSGIAPGSGDAIALLGVHLAQSAVSMLVHVFLLCPSAAAALFLSCGAIRALSHAITLALDGARVGDSGPSAIVADGGAEGPWANSEAAASRAFAADAHIVYLVDALLFFIPSAPGTFDSLNATLPFVQWQNEGDMRTKSDFDEALSLRLEKEYQRQRRVGLFAPYDAHTSAVRPFKIDFLTMRQSWGASSRLSRACHRRPIVTAFTHCRAQSVEEYHCSCSNADHCDATSALGVGAAAAAAAGPGGGAGGGESASTSSTAAASAKLVRSRLARAPFAFDPTRSRATKRLDEACRLGIPLVLGGDDDVSSGSDSKASSAARRKRQQQQQHVLVLDDDHHNGDFGPERRSGSWYDLLCCCSVRVSKRCAPEERGAAQRRLEEHFGEPVAAAPCAASTVSVAIASSRDVRECLTQLPATRSVFMSTSAAREFATSVVPCLLTLLRGSPHHLVMRHAAILLLRCLSLIRRSFLVVRSDGVVGVDASIAVAEVLATHTPALSAAVARLVLANQYGAADRVVGPAPVPTWTVGGSNGGGVGGGAAGNAQLHAGALLLGGGSAAESSTFVRTPYAPTLAGEMLLAARHITDLAVDSGAARLIDHLSCDEVQLALHRIASGVASAAVAAHAGAAAGTSGPSSATNNSVNAANSDAVAASGSSGACEVHRTRAALLSDIGGLVAGLAALLVRNASSTTDGPPNGAAHPGAPPLPSLQQGPWSRSFTSTSAASEDDDGAASAVAAAALASQRSTGGSIGSHEAEEVAPRNPLVAPPLPTGADAGSQPPSLISCSPAATRAAEAMRLVVGLLRRRGMRMRDVAASFPSLIGIVFSELEALREAAAGEAPTTSAASALSQSGPPLLPQQCVPLAQLLAADIADELASSVGTSAGTLTDPIVLMKAVTPQLCAAALAPVPFAVSCLQERLGRPLTLRIAPLFRGGFGAVVGASGGGGGGGGGAASPATELATNPRLGTPRGSSSSALRPPLRIGGHEFQPIDAQLGIEEILVHAMPFATVGEIAADALRKISLSLVDECVCGRVPGAVLCEFCVANAVAGVDISGSNNGVANSLASLPSTAGGRVQGRGPLLVTLVLEGVPLLDPNVTLLDALEAHSGAAEPLRRLNEATTPQATRAALHKAMALWAHHHRLHFIATSAPPVPTATPTTPLCSPSFSQGGFGGNAAQHGSSALTRPLRSPIEHFLAARSELARLAIRDATSCDEVNTASDGGSSERVVASQLQCGDEAAVSHAAKRLGGRKRSVFVATSSPTTAAECPAASDAVGASFGPGVADAAAPWDTDRRLQLLELLSVCGGVVHDALPLRLLAAAALYELRSQALSFVVPCLAALTNPVAVGRGPTPSALAAVGGEALASYALWNYPAIFPLAVRRAALFLVLNAKRLAVPRGLVVSPLMSRGVVGGEWLPSESLVHMHATNLQQTPGASLVEPASVLGAALRRRQKIRVSRALIAEDAEDVLAAFSHSPVALDAEFEGEQGVGAGPTQEFFTLAAAQFVDDAALWSAAALTRGLLFPRAVSPSAAVSVESHEQRRYTALGRLLARVLCEGRLAMLPLHPVFLHGVTHSSPPANLRAAFAAVDPAYDASLRQLECASDATLRALDMTFTVDVGEAPTTSVELLPGGTSVGVTRENVAAFCDAVRRFFLFDGIRHAIRWVQAGLGGLIAHAHLRLFSGAELDAIVVGARGRLWATAEAFLASIAAGHGYTTASEPVAALALVVAQWDQAAQRAFLRFLSGSECFPIGGLTPPITIVRKDPPPPPHSPDDVLPTASTCFHFLKLPPYSSAEVLRARLEYAIAEGGNRFTMT